MTMPQVNKKWGVIRFTKPWTRKILFLKVHYDRSFYVKYLVPRELRHIRGNSHSRSAYKRVKNYKKYHERYSYNDDLMKLLKQKGHKIKFLKAVGAILDQKWDIVDYEYVPIYKQR